MLTLFIAVLAAPFLVDRTVGFVLRRCAKFLPDDIAGPDGWLQDTKSSTGVFDRA